MTAVVTSSFTTSFVTSTGGTLPDFSRDASTFDAIIRYALPQLSGTHEAHTFDWRRQSCQLVSAIDYGILKSEDSNRMLECTTILPEKTLRYEVLKVVTRARSTSF